MPAIRKNARDVERRLGEAIDACSMAMESSPFDVVQRLIREAQALLDQVRSTPLRLNRHPTYPFYPLRVPSFLELAYLGDKDVFIAPAFTNRISLLYPPSTRPLDANST